MSSNARFQLAIAALLFAGNVGAVKLNKCVDRSGNVTFTQQACADGSGGELVRVQSGGAGMSLAPSMPVAEEEPNSSNGSKEITVVGGPEAGACGVLDERSARTAIVQNKIAVGMTAKQAIQSWGNPTRVNSASSGLTQWVYETGPVSAQYIYIDTRGCVADWN